MLFNKEKEKAEVIQPEVEELTPGELRFKKIYTRFNQVKSQVIFYVLLFTILPAFATFLFDFTQGTGQGLIFGKYKPIFILTGSMEPALKTNGIIISEYVELDKDISSVQVGDIITYTIHDEYQQKDIVITHRLVSIDEESKTVRTKGDNNGQVDMYAIPYENVLFKTISIQNWTAGVIAAAQRRSTQIAIVGFLLGFWILGRELNKMFYDEDLEFKSRSRKKKEAKQIELATEKLKPELESKLREEIEAKVREELKVKPYVGDTYAKELENISKEPE